MLYTVAILAASLMRFLDPHTSVFQTDDPEAGCRLAAESGYWPVPCGLANPRDEKSPPRIIHTVFRKHAATPSGYEPDSPSPLFKINEVGYLPQAPKFAYLGAWLGPELGGWEPEGEGTGNGERGTGSWKIVDASSGNVVLRSGDKNALVRRVKDMTAKNGAAFTGEKTFEIDFSPVTNEGSYYIEVANVGRSETFRISASAPEDAFRVHMLGLYQKRCGIAKALPYTHWTSGECHAKAVRGSFPPDEGKFEPGDVKYFDIIRSTTAWERAEEIEVRGGWHDAADFDRRPAHLNIVCDLCSVYLMRQKNFCDGQLAIPECSNGIPDILDEAEWGLRHILAAQQPDGGAGTWIESTGHPSVRSAPESDTLRYAVSRATRRSSMYYAAAASLLARCHPAFREKYLESAKKAWQWAVAAKPAKEYFAIARKSGWLSKKKTTVHWTEDENLPPGKTVQAAVNLAALTQDPEYLDFVKRDIANLAKRAKRDFWKWPPLLFAGERALGLPEGLEEFFAPWDKFTLEKANELVRETNEAWAYRAPWFPPQDKHVDSMAWGRAHPLRRAGRLIAAHAMTLDAKYLDAASLANDFHNGCNPMGSTLTSGLGETYPVAFLDIPSYADSIAEYVPGITPFRWTWSLPQKTIDEVFHGNKERANRWPVWRRWGNLECKTPPASEFSVWETVAPAASVTGYLISSPTKWDGKPYRKPEDDIAKLKGYWLLP